MRYRPPCSTLNYPTSATGSPLRTAWPTATASAWPGLDLVLPQTVGPAYHGYHLFVVRTPRRDALAEHLDRAGIATTVHYPTPLPLHACYADRHSRAEDYPVAVELSQTALSLPMYAELREDQVDYVTERIKQFFAA